MLRAPPPAWRRLRENYVVGAVRRPVWAIRAARGARVPWPRGEGLGRVACARRRRSRLQWRIGESRIEERGIGVLNMTPGSEVP